MKTITAYLPRALDARNFDQSNCVNPSKKGEVGLVPFDRDRKKENSKKNEKALEPYGIWRVRRPRE